LPGAAAQQVATPTFTPAGAVYNLEQPVRIDCTTAGATINYTTNGVDPTSSDRSVAPGGTVLVDHPITLKARATKTGLSPSAVKSAAYSIIGKFAAGQNHSLTAKSDGTVWAWGSNASGQLGRGSTSASPLPAPAQVKTNSTTFLTNASSVAGGASHSVAVKTDGTIWAWGSNASGQIGDGTTTQRLYAVQVKLSGGAAFTGAVDVVAGSDYCVALKADGTVWAWGLNSSGQIGNGTTTTPQKNPVQVKVTSSTFLTGIVAIVAGSAHSLALKSDGTVWAWGLNSSGQLGNTNTTNQTLAVQVKAAGGTAFTGGADVATGANHSLAKKTDGTLWAWGSNANGQLADGTTNPISTSKQTNAVQVKASASTFLTGVTAMAGGTSHSIASKTDGTLWSWGINTSNQLGDGTATQRVFPVQVKDTSGGFITGIVDLFGGASHTLATKSDGTAWGWGLNSLGQTGSSNTGINPNVANQITMGSAPFFIIKAFDDPDLDTLKTWYERELGTNPNNFDTDGDSLSDDYELNHGLNPVVNDAYLDADHDGLTNLQEYQLNTNPQNPDTDTDGALDGEDVYPLDLHFALKKMPLSTYAVVEAVSGGGDRVKFNNLNSILYSQSYVWRGGAPLYLGSGITAMGMNDSGQIAGYIGGTSSRAVMGTGPGSFRILDDLGGAARAINNAGVVVGWATFPGDYSAAARLDTGPPPTLLGAALTPTAMNDVGDVVGEVVQYYSAAIWTGGTTTPLSGFTYPYAVNKDKYVAGTHWGTNFGQDHWIPLAWHDGETKHLPCQSNTMRSEAFSINKDGLMVGYTYTLAADYIPMLWQNAQYYNMNNLLDADAYTAGWTIGMLWAINDNGVIVASGYRSGFGGLILLVPTPAVQLITPSGDPVSAPVDAAVDGQNEFTFSNSSPGVLSVHFKAKVLATGTAGSLASRCRFTVDAIPGSTMAWSANNPGGQPTNTSGDYLEADVTFTGLPANNSDFGRKNVKITVDGVVKDQKVMEVFYPKDETNHGGGNATDPNWFHYWKQFIPLDRIATVIFVRPQGSNYAATDPVARNTQIFQKASEENDATGDTGLHAFYQVLVHENRHISLWEGWWGVGGTPNQSLDIDGDSYPDSFESAPIGQQFFFSVGSNDDFLQGVPSADPNAPFPGMSAGFNYEETECKNAAMQVTATPYDQLDWSYDPLNFYQGKQHK
jgi:alpha-tubulin suppressor-like RCC1 family protein